MTAYPITLHHPVTGLTYVAVGRLEMMEAIQNGWLLRPDAPPEVPPKTSKRVKAVSNGSPSVA